MNKKYYVNVTNADGQVIARVQYNTNLDYWSGRNWENPSSGMHKGLTKLKDKRYVLITGSDWQGQTDTAQIISAPAAIQEILKSGNLDLLNLKKFKDLKELYKKMELEALEDDEIS